MGKITFIIGGARSGKSTYAIKLAQGRGRTVAFVATCQGFDKEMKKRIADHKNRRPKAWLTFEEPLEPGRIIKKIKGRFDVIVLDCITLLVSNLLLEGLNQKNIEVRINEALASFKETKADSIIVSNEVGLGIVPDTSLGRDFRDIAGRMNQVIAKASDEVFFMVSGLPVKIK
jgi:adenosylcobinamide kinase/adenosylcobinamide-phosphate guanylyltransferase